MWPGCSMDGGVGCHYAGIDCEVAPSVDINECLGPKQQACVDITRRQRCSQGLRVLSGRSDDKVGSTITWLGFML